MSARNFSLRPKGNGYCMTRDGEQSIVEFDTFQKAMAYARNCEGSLESRVRVFDVFGNETMSFPAKLPEKSLARVGG